MARQVDLSVGLHVGSELAWAVLCDFDQWQEWMPSIRRSQVLVREGDVAVVELIPVGAQRKILLEMVESREVELRFTEVGRYGSDALSGRCRLTKSSDGLGGSLAIELNPGEPWWKRRRRRLAKRLLPVTLDALGQRCLDLAESPFAKNPSGRQTLIEILASESDLVLRLGDRDYRLSEVESP